MSFLPPLIDRSQRGFHQTWLLFKDSGSRSMLYSSPFLNVVLCSPSWHKDELKRDVLTVHYTWASTPWRASKGCLPTEMSLKYLVWVLTHPTPTPSETLLRCSHFTQHHCPLAYRSPWSAWALEDNDHVLLCPTAPDTQFDDCWINVKCGMGRRWHFLTSKTESVIMAGQSRSRLSTQSFINRFSITERNSPHPIATPVISTRAATKKAEGSVKVEFQMNTHFLV